MTSSSPIMPLNIEPQLCMEHPMDGPLPPLVLPPGYSIRAIAREEGHVWEKVMDEAFGMYNDHYEPGSFEYVMAENHDYHPSRVFILFDEIGCPCATASSWRQHWRWGKGVGYVLFVGVSQSHQGRRLGSLMTLYLLHNFAANHLKPAILNTDDGFLPAIKTYLKLGFKPRIVHENQFARWQQIFERLGTAPIEYSREIRPPLGIPYPAGPTPYQLGLEP
jgi:mycothiol synthase